eukprot:3100321-Amphidinium_carterae.5
MSVACVLWVGGGGDQDHHHDPAPDLAASSSFVSDSTTTARDKLAQFLANLPTAVGVCSPVETSGPCLVAPSCESTCVSTPGIKERVDTPANDEIATRDLPQTQHISSALRPLETLDAFPRSGLRGKHVDTRRWREQHLSTKQIGQMHERLLEDKKSARSRGKHVIYLTTNGQTDPVSVQLAALHCAPIPWKTAGKALACATCGRVSPTFEKLKFMSMLRPSLQGDGLGTQSTCPKRKSCERECAGDRSLSDDNCLPSKKVARVISLATSLNVALQECGSQSLGADAQTVQSLRILQRLNNVCDPLHEGGFRLTTLNIGGLGDKMDGLLGLASDCVALQEVGVHHSKTPKYTRAAKMQNSSMSFGITPCTRLDTMGRQYIQKHLGLGMFARDTCATSKCNKQFACDTEDALRVSSWLVVFGPVVLHVHVVYLHWSPVDSWDARNEKLLNHFLERVATLRGQCQVVLGDFHCRACDRLEVNRLLHFGWHSAVLSSGCTHTNTPACGQAQVLDDILISPELTPYLEPFVVEDVEGFSTHRVLSVDLNFQQNLRTLGGLRFDSPLAACEVGSCADKLGLSPEEWWTQQMHDQLGNDAQSIYSAWLRSLNLWLGVTDCTERGKCQRGAMTSHWVDSVQHSSKEYEPLAWHRHIAKKSSAHLKELKAHGDRGCFDCDRCRLLRRNFQSS